MNPLLLDVPLELETERLILRAPLQAGDGEVVYQAIEDSIYELKSWLSLFQEPPTVEEVEIMLRNAHINFLKEKAFVFLYLTKVAMNLLELRASMKLTGTFQNVKLDTGLAQNIVVMDI